MFNLMEHEPSKCPRQQIMLWLQGLLLFNLLFVLPDEGLLN
jgi:hypothetical protein